MSNNSFLKSLGAGFIAGISCAVLAYPTMEHYKRRGMMPKLKKLVNGSLKLRKSDSSSVSLYSQSGYDIGKDSNGEFYLTEECYATKSVHAGKDDNGNDMYVTETDINPHCTEVFRSANLDDVLWQFTKYVNSIKTMELAPTLDLEKV
jgi:hypothetical protein